MAPDPAVPAPRPLTAERRSLPDRLRYLADHVAAAADSTLVDALLDGAATVEELQAEVESLRTRLAATTTVYARNCDDCPGGTDWQQRAEDAEARLAATTTQRDAAVGLVRTILERVALTLDIESHDTDQQPLTNYLLYALIGEAMTGDEWAWPVTDDEAAVLDAIRDKNPPVDG